ncbi:C2 domain-containing protein 3-like, partial [Elysia marginata]
IVFEHESLFPIVFDADTLDKWWSSALVFRLFHKESHGPTVLVGSGGISLKSILRSQNLSVVREIEIADGRKKSVINSPRSSSLNSSLTLFGQLKVSVMLASDPEQPLHQDLFDANKDSNFVKSLKKTVDLPVSSKASSTNKRTVSGLPPQSPRPRPQEKLEASQLKLQLQDVMGADKISLPQADFSTLQLQALISIQEGSRASQLAGSNNQTLMEGHGPLGCNTYVICKMLWCKDALHSDVCWGTHKPRFNFLQVTPVHLTAVLLERLKDNHVIVEVWDRRVGASGDKLIGMVKLSVQQFFLSFRDKKIARALLNSEYPVVAIDNFMPIVDPFSGLHVGQLKVLLAMGSDIQVANLKAVALSFGDLLLMPGRAETEARVSGLIQNERSMAGKETHEFSVQIDGLSGLYLSDNMIWGEADCFIQFFFPSQGGELKDKLSAGDGPASLKCYRTVTTLCTPDAAFHDTSVHKFILPVGVPVQRELLTACAKSSGSVSGLSFEVWCRYYQPNIRDQLIAKCVLPLAKLSAMITMHKPGEPCVQAFSLKLSKVGTDLAAGDTESFTKSAAEHVARFDPSMKYPGDVGVNAYVRINISLFGKENEKVTKTIAKSFAPEYSHFVDMSCPLVISNGHGNSTSLAELLESGIATFEIWHQVSHTSYHENQQRLNRDGIAVQKFSQRSGDILLGTSVLPLTSLLSRRTGLNGWFPINLPSLAWEEPDHGSEMQTAAALDQAVGGLELSLKFLHQDDFDRVVQAARNVGWSSFDMWPEQMDWGEEDDPTRSYNITLVIDHVSFPSELAVIKGESTLNKAARYLREEKLEIQVWLTFGRDQDSKRSRQRDKWLGSCYIDLESLTGTRRGRQRVSGLFPIFKPATDNLKSAFVKADIVSRLSSTSKHTSSPSQKSCYDESDSVTETEQSMEDIQLWAKNFTVDKSPTKKGKSEEQGFVDVSSFGVLLAIERAMHLPMVTERNRSGEVNPTTYVSYQSAERSKPSCTPVFPNTCNPTWDYAVETRLNSQYLHDANKVSITPQDQQPVSVPSSNSFMLPMFGKTSSLMDSHSQTVADQLLSLQQQLKHWMASQTSKLFSSGGDVTTASNPPGLDEDSSASGQTASASTAEPQPKLNLTTVSDDTPTSYLFSSLRRQLEDLDVMTQKMKLRLSTTSDSDTGQPPINSGRSADILNGTVSGISTIHTASSLMNTRERFHAESSENGVSQELSHSRSINISTLEFPAEATDKPEQKSAMGPSGKFLDSGVFSSKNFYDRSEDNDPDSQHSGRTVTLDPSADQDSSSLSANRLTSQPRTADTLETGSHGDAVGKTQPFIPAGDSSETSGNSHGFQPDPLRVNDTNTLTSVNYFPASRSEAEVVGAGTSSDAVSTLGSKHSRASDSLKSEQTVVYEDGDEYAGEEEDRRENDNSVYGSYHRYRAFLDEEEKDVDKTEKRDGEEGEEEEEDDVVEIVPRSLNNMSTVLALQAKEGSEMSEGNVEEDSLLPGVGNTNPHPGNSSFCSGDNDDSFFQEVVFTQNNSQPVENQKQDDGFSRLDVDVAADQVQALQISDVEDWLDKHVLESNGEDQQHRDISSYSDNANNEGVTQTFCEVKDMAEPSLADSSLKNGKLTTPREVTISDEGKEQDTRLELFDGKEEVPSSMALDDKTEVLFNGNVWTQDIEDSSDEETLPQRESRTGSGKEIEKTSQTLGGMHLDLDSENHEPSNHHMKCLARVELENSSNSGESHRSASSATVRRCDSLDQVGVNQGENTQLENRPSGTSTSENPVFDYPFTLELEDMNPTLKTNSGHEHRVGVDFDESPPASPHSGDSQASDGTSTQGKTGDTPAAKGQSCDDSVPDALDIKANNEQETEEKDYVETHVDSTVDSAYVDGDGYQPSSAGMNTSSRGPGSVYSFMQDDSGVGQLCRTMSDGSNRIKLTNFFMPAEDMEASLRTLQSATSGTDSGAHQKNLRVQQKVMATSQLVSKLAERRTVMSTSVKNKRPPSAKEAKRIAKIFTSKAS